MIKKWMKTKLGIKDQSAITIEQGRMIADGFAEGIRKAQDHIMVNDQPVCTRDVLVASEKLSAMTGDDIDTSMNMILDGLEKGMDKVVDKMDTSQNVHDVHTWKENVHDVHTSKTHKSVSERRIRNQETARDNHTIIEPLLDEVRQVVWEQQEKVLASGKYDHPVHKDNHTAMEWMDHQMSEFADALVYHQALKQTVLDAIGYMEQAKAMNNEMNPYVDHRIDQALDRLKGGGF